MFLIFTWGVGYDSEIQMVRSKTSSVLLSIVKTSYYINPDLWLQEGEPTLIKSSYLSSSLSFSQFPRKFPNWHEWTCSWIWRRNASLNSKACGNCSIKCHTHSKNWVNTGETSFGSPSKWPHLTTQKTPVFKNALKELHCVGNNKLKHTYKK